MKLIILDRDGVINEDSDQFIKSIDEWIPLPGSIEAIGRLSRAGYTVTVATNQSGIARGYFDVATLDAMHDKMRQLAAQQGGAIDSIFYCPHGPDDDCDCRKPKAGLFRQIADHYRIELNDIPAVGDSLRDLQAAAASGARPILVLTGKGGKTLKSLAEDDNTPVFDDLSSAVDYLLVDNA